MDVPSVIDSWDSLWLAMAAGCVPLTVAIVRFAPSKKAHNDVSKELCDQRHSDLDRTLNNICSEVRDIKQILMRRGVD